MIPIRPGEPGKQPFWNEYAQRFIYVPAFDMPEVTGALSYRFTVTCSDGIVKQFTDEKPWAALSPIWDEVPEGYTTLIVEGIDSKNMLIGKSGERSFYRSPVFPGDVPQPKIPYEDAAISAFGAIHELSYVKHWQLNDKPDRSYSHYCYPNKVIGGLIRAMAAYSRMTNPAVDSTSALQIARQSADYLLSISLPATSHFAGIPPTYENNVDSLLFGAVRGIENNWFMTTSSIDVAFGFLDLFDVTKEPKYYEAALRVAEVLLATQDSDGTWPHMVNEKTGEQIGEQRLVPTWVIFFFDRLENQYQVKEYKTSRNRAWEWIVQNTLKTFQFDGQFEDGKPTEPYKNLSREQACDIAVLLLNSENDNEDTIGQAEELLRFAEDQFVVWTNVQDCQGWLNAITYPRNCEIWITPSVLEQYTCYDPVARSSAVLINAYITIFDITKNNLYASKAKALANGLLKGQKWLAEEMQGDGLIPTWVMKGTNDDNWINNSFYAAEAMENVARLE